MTSQSADNQAALDILAQLQDPQWALAAAQIETEANCDVGAGLDWGPYLANFLTDPHSFHQLQRLRSLVLRALRQLLADGKLGIGLEAALAVGKQRLFLRLQQPTPDIQEQLKTVLAEDLQSPPENTSRSDATQALLQQTIAAVLTADDWDAIAAAAAIQQHVTQNIARSNAA